MHLQLKKWLQTGAIEYAGEFEHIMKTTNPTVHTILPISIERTKPRVCVDGGAPKAISPEKIKCELDDIFKLMAASQKGCWYAKTDDSNGYQHINLNPQSSKMRRQVQPRE